MRYKNHIMTVFYLPGSDFTVKNGHIINRKQGKPDIDYIETIDSEGYKLANCSTFIEAKRQIDDMIVKYGK